MRIKSKNISIIYKLFICIIGLISIFMCTGILDGSYNARVFTMFTTISNILCVIYFAFDIIYLLMDPKSNYAKDAYPTFKHMVSLAIFLTCVVATFLLDIDNNFDSFGNASLIGLHYIVPIMVIMDWVLFEKKGTIKKYEPFVWLIFPAVYFALAEFSAIFGNGFGMEVGEKYPYFFLDVEELGLLNVSLYALIIGLGCLITGYIFYFIDSNIKKGK